MTTYRDFQLRATECMRLARQAGTAHDRDLFLRLAVAWRGLAPESPTGPASKEPASPSGAESEHDARRHH